MTDYNHVINMNDDMFLVSSDAEQTEQNVDEVIITYPSLPGWFTGGGGGAGVKSKYRGNNKKKPSRFIANKRQQDNIIRADRTDPISQLAPSNLTSGRGAR